MIDTIIFVGREVRDMIPPFQSKQSMLIDAPLEVVWEFSMDLTKILSFHPCVFKVDLLSGKSRTLLRCVSGSFGACSFLFH